MFILGLISATNERKTLIFHFQVSGNNKIFTEIIYSKEICNIQQNFFIEVTSFLKTFSC